MATLHERLIGAGVLSDVAGESKIAIHAYTGALNEFRRGKLNGADLVAFFDLVGDQQTDTILYKDLWQACPDKQEYMRIFKDWLYLGETSTDPLYLSGANFQTRLEIAVTDNGGAVP